MIARTHRFHGRGSIRAIYRNGTLVRSQLFSLKYQIRADGRPYRIAVVVSRKVSKSAVRRNRIRRRIYEQIRALEPRSGMDGIITVFSERLIDVSHDQLADQLSSVLKKTEGL